jgi:uncharacterized phage protein (TIGR01671 family)
MDKKMREIKFRYYWKHDRTNEVRAKDYTLENIRRGEVQGPDYTIRWDLITEAQYTGLKDKNGKEIYEGDVISWDYEYDSDYDGDMPIVKRSTGKAAIKDIFDRERIFTARQEGKGVEVIGNIYENPELLNHEPEA